MITGVVPPFADAMQAIAVLEAAGLLLPWVVGDATD